MVAHGSGLTLRIFLEKAAVLSHDVAMTAVAYLLSLFIAYGLSITPLLDGQAGTSSVLMLNALLLMGVALPVFYIERLYQGFWRYTGFTDVVKLLRAATLIVLIFLPVTFLTTRGEALPRSSLPLLWLLMVALLVWPRMITRMAWEGDMLSGFFRSSTRKDTIPVLLIGVGDRAESFIREMNRTPDSPYRVAGILTDNESLRNRRLQNVEVLGTLDDAAQVIVRLASNGIHVGKLVLAERSIPEIRIRALLDLAVENGLTLARLPRSIDMQDGRNDPVRPVNLSDLLGRPQVKLDRAGLADLIRGRRVLVTGAGGSIGSELVRQLAALGPCELTMLDNSEYLLFSIDNEIAQTLPEQPRRELLCNVRDRDQLFRWFETLRPEIVFHAAALKHVPMMEHHPCEAVLTNVVGTRNVADAARHVNAQAMVLVSTDKAVNPANVMGATKRLAESFCQTLDVASGPSATRFLTVRFGNVLGSNGSVVPLFQKQIETGGPVTVTHPDVTRYFMTIPEAVELILQATKTGLADGIDHGRIFVLDMGEPVRIIDLAHQMIRLSGKRPDLDIKVEVVGLRPGEKLYEELIYDAEEVVPSGQDRLLVASPRTADLEILAKAISDIEVMAQNADNDGVRRMLRTVVPAYHPGTAELRRDPEPPRLQVTPAPVTEDRLTRKA